MKLVRYKHGEKGGIGAVVDDKTVVDLTSVTAGAGSCPMRAFLALGEEGMHHARQIVADPPAGSQLPLTEVTLLAPLRDPNKILCIGQNYRDHCEEQNQPIPERAILFSKYSTAINDPGGVVKLLAISDQPDYECELAVVIGGPAAGTRNVSEADAMNYVAGYMCANDVTARDIQKGDGQWVRGKSPDTYFPIGPYLVTADEVADPHNLDISLTLNGQTMQKSNTLNLIFKIPFLISYLSQSMTLLPGDIISTGTPGGVGVFRKPPIFLKAGDTMSVTISGLGTLTNTVA